MMNGAPAGIPPVALCGSLDYDIDRSQKHVKTDRGRAFSRD
jgi:hypothetical protein